MIGRRTVLLKDERVACDPKHSAEEIGHRANTTHSPSCRHPWKWDESLQWHSLSKRRLISDLLKAEWVHYTDGLETCSSFLVPSDGPHTYSFCELSDGSCRLWTELFSYFCRERDFGPCSFLHYPCIGVMHRANQIHWLSTKFNPCKIHQNQCKIHANKLLLLLLL